MFMPFLVGAAIAIGLVQLGALSVWVSVMLLALKVLLAIALAAVLVVVLPYLWRRYKARSVRSE